MRFGFLNNFSDQIAAPVSDTATDIELAGKASDIQTALQSADAVALTLFATDDQGNETQREVVYATVAAPPLVTVTRAQEGTTAGTFAPGDGCEGRLTAGVMTDSERKHTEGPGSVTGADSIALNVSSTASGVQSIAAGYNATASGIESVSAGSLAQAAGEASVAVGRSTEAMELGSLAVGDKAKSGHSYSLAIGYEATTNDSNCISIGRGSVAGNWADGGYDASDAICIAQNGNASGKRTVVVGANAGTEDKYGSIAIGAWAYTETHGALALGLSAYSYGVYSTAIGPMSEASAADAVGLGLGASAGIEGGLRVSALSYLPATVSDTVTSSTSINPDDVQPAATNSTRRASQQVTIATDAIDLTSLTANFTLNLPAGTILLPDTFDVVVVAASGAGGAPEIQIGPDDVTPASYLAAKPVTKTAVGGRHTFTPLVADGVTSLRVSVATAGTGTTYSVKVVARGYVMEV